MRWIACYFTPILPNIHGVCTELLYSSNPNHTPTVGRGGKRKAVEVLEVPDTLTPAAHHSPSIEFEDV